MVVRFEVEEFVRAGVLPPEDDCTEEEIDARFNQLERIVKPVTAEEAQMLLKVFGDDSCYGLASTLLHLIETAPRDFPITERLDNEWVQMLLERRRISG